MGLSEAVKSRGSYDAWEPQLAMEVFPVGKETVHLKIVIKLSSRFVFFFLLGTITDPGLSTDSKICPGHRPGARNRRAAPGDTV